MKDGYVIKSTVADSWFGALKNYQYAIQYTDKELEKMSDLEKLTLSIKTDSMRKVLFLIEMILNPEGELGDRDYEFLKSLIDPLMLRLDLGIDKMAKMFAKDQTKAGLPLFPKK